MMALARTVVVLLTVFVVAKADSFETKLHYADDEPGNNNEVAQNPEEVASNSEMDDPEDVLFPMNQVERTTQKDNKDHYSQHDASDVSVEESFDEGGLQQNEEDDDSEKGVIIEDDSTDVSNEESFEEDGIGLNEEDNYSEKDDAFQDDSPELSNEESYDKEDDYYEKDEAFQADSSEESDEESFGEDGIQQDQEDDYPKNDDAIENDSTQVSEEESFGGYPQNPLMDF